MTETTTAPQGAPTGEPVATPVTPVTDSGTETTAKTVETAEQLSPDATKAKEPWFMRRINQQSAKIAAQAREIEAQKALLSAKTEPSAADPTQPIPGMVPASEVDRLANQRSEQREFERKVSDWDTAGRKEFPDFVQQCNEVAAMGAAERPEFMRIVADIDNGHKLIPLLAQNPDEAARILALPQHRMAIELGKLSLKQPAPKPVSAAPEPIKPLGSPAGGKANSLSDDASTAEWMKARQAQIEAKSPRRR